jgi:TetR/AcrR family transcriptional regulator, regulator of autoinduction and epiphytic fitness
VSDDKPVSRLERKKAEILEAATAVFREEGYDTTSMDRIAERAGASKRTVYNHFGSKEALFQAVVASSMAEMAKLKQIAWDPARTLEAQLTDFARAKSMIASDPAYLGLMRVVLGVFIREPELARATMQRAVDGDTLVTWLTAADEAGRMRVPNPKLAAEVFWGAVSGALFWPATFGLEMGSDERAAVTDEIIATFLSRYGA